MAKRKRVGRPPSGAQGELVSHYPKLTISMAPETKAQLSALTTLTNKPAWRIVEEALRLYIEQMEGEDRHVLDVLAKRVRARGPG